MLPDTQLWGTRGPHPHPVISQGDSTTRPGRRATAKGLPPRNAHLSLSCLWQQLPFWEGLGHTVTAVAAKLKPARPALFAAIRVSVMQARSACSSACQTRPASPQTELAFFSRSLFPGKGEGSPANFSGTLRGGDAIELGNEVHKLGTGWLRARTLIRRGG